MHRVAEEVADPEVRETLFERLVGSDLLDAGGPAAADARVEALVTGAKAAAGRADASPPSRGRLF